jgi:hypothetical protein
MTQDSQRRRTVIVDDSSLPATQPEVTKALSQALMDAGEQVEPIRALQLIESSALRDVRLMVLPAARSLPLAAIPQIEQFLRSGGQLIACGLALGAFGVFRANDRWIPYAEYQELASATKAQHMLVQFGHDELKDWKRDSDSKAPTTIDDVENVLHAKIPQLTGWDTISTTFETPFPAGHTLTCFRAKGDATTKQLAIEWQETDGSRWIATVPLNEQWMHYALPADAFEPWQPPKGRGGPNDRLDVSKARRFAVGLAFSHTEISRGAHEYWFADLGTAPPPFGIEPAKTKPAHLEGLSPAYQFYPVHAPVRLRTTPDQCIVSSGEIEAPPMLIAMHPRPSAAGFGKSRPWRWQPLIEAFDPKTKDHRGAVAALVAGLRDPWRGSAWACFTPGDASFYSRPLVQQIITDVARAFRRGILLEEAGSQFFTQFDDQPIRLRARTLQLAQSDSKGLGLRITVAPPGQQPQFQKELNDATTAEAEWKPPSWADKGYVITTELRQDDYLIDRIVHPCFAYRLKKNPEYVQIRDGDFVANGKPWRINGLNYMPSSGIGRSLDENNEFEHWIGAAAYDPAIIERDLKRVAAMGVNAVSAFIYHESLAAGNLLDFLRQCERNNLKVNLSLRPGTPLDFDWEKWKAIIEQSKLAQSDVVFAYDVAWEPTHGSREAQQKNYTSAWREWVVKNYGSLSAAAKTWAVDAPRTRDGQLDVPTSDQLFADGDWRKLAADYRAFLDDFLAEKYGHARDLIRSIDPNHFVSFRMNIAGDPTADDRNMLAYDFWGLRHAVDFFGPEAYGRIGDWERVKEGRFTVDYARLCDPTKPLVWAEAGVSVWDNLISSAREDRLKFQADFYRDLYRMLRESGSDCVFFWWYPGGYRTNERSDFGIINPDGTDRPVTQVVREEGRKFLSAPKPAPPDTWIEVDRDKDARGLYGIYQSAKGYYWSTIDRGKRPGLKWSHPSGTAG